MLSYKQQILKRFFDIIMSLIGIILTFIPLLCLLAMASFSSRSFGIFFQERIGRNAQTFTLFKIKTMNVLNNGERKLTRFGGALRKTKLDELPQLFNVLFGSMSMVGPRPDIKGYADLLKKEDRIILSVRPGITGPASLKFSNEDELLVQQENPLEYNDTVLWPQKIEINKKYIEKWSFFMDINYLIFTIRKLFR
jgi:lipopolysaccharide/colanic/teichoic acid biosynthesis glycosyltransferase